MCLKINKILNLMKSIKKKVVVDPASFLDILDYYFILNIFSHFSHFYYFQFLKILLFLSLSFIFIFYSIFLVFNFNRKVFSLVFYFTFSYSILISNPFNIINSKEKLLWFFYLSCCHTFFLSLFSHKALFYGNCFYISLFSQLKLKL